MVFKASSLLLCAACILITSTIAMNPNLSNWNLSNEDQKLAHATLVIIRDHISDLTPAINIAEHSTDPAMALKNAAILDYILQNLHETISVELDISQSKLEYFVLIVDSRHSFLELYMNTPVYDEEWRTTGLMKSNSFHFIIVLTSATEDSDFIINSIFEECSYYSRSDANIIAFSPLQGVISVYTYDLFSEKGCNLAQPYVYFTTNQDFESFKIIFPQKFNNFYGCPLKVIVRNSPPFLTFEGKFDDPQPVREWENLTGFEGMLVKHLSYALNFTIKLQLCKILRRCFWAAHVRLADIAIGSLSSSDSFNSSFVSTSIAYYSTELMHVVRGKEISPLGVLAKPFSTSLWLLITIILTIISFLILQLRFMKPSIRHFILGKNNKMPLMNLFAILVGHSVAGEPRRNFARFCFMMLVILALVLRTCYQGAQFEALRKYKNLAPTPTGFKELVEQNYVMLLPEFMVEWELYKQSSVITSKEHDKERLEVLDKTEGNNASIVLRDSYDFYMAETYRHQTESQLIMINEVFCKYQMIMVFKKNSIYLNIFNEKLQSLIESGIISKLIKEIKLEGDMYDEEKATRSVNEKFTLRHLQGVFEIYLCLCIGAIAVFVFEMFSKYCKALRKVFEWID